MIEYFEIGGSKRPVKFGTNQTMILCKHRGITLKQVSEMLSASKFENAEMDGSEIRDLIYSAMVAGARTEKKEVDFDDFQVGDWIDEMDKAELNKIMSFYIESLLPNEKRAEYRQKQEENQKNSPGIAA